MIRYLDILHAIETAARPPAGDGTLSDLVEQYGRVIAEVGDRLRLCDAYLNRGLRSEALHLAGCSPKLADVIPALQPADRVSLDERLARCGVGPLPTLPSGTLEWLDAARAKERRLKSTLARHRSLALANAPVNERIDTLRSLAAADPASLIWTSGLRQFEHAYLAQVRDTANTALKARDRDTLVRLIAELESAGTGAGEPHAKFLVKLHAALASLDDVLARDALGGVLDGVAKAHANQDANATRVALQEWEAATGKFGRPIPPAYQQRLLPALAWLDSLERDTRHEEKRAAIQAQLDDERRWKWFGRK